jgi:hypothetical protein
MDREKSINGSDVTLVNGKKITTVSNRKSG